MNQKTHEELLAFDDMMLGRKIDFAIMNIDADGDRDYILNCDGEPCCKECGSLSINCGCPKVAL